jgi:hypothetical protein
LGIDELNRVAFIHIPKCAGTTVANQLKRLPNWRWDEGLIDHPKLGQISPAHIPLVFLRDNYPDNFAKLSACESFALVRDPHDRFASAVFERIDWYLGVNRIEVTIDQALGEARRVIDWLCGRERFCDAEYIHFSRQVDYVALDGEQLVRHVYPVEEMGRFGEHLSRVAGVAFDESRKANVNYALPRDGVFGMLYRLRPIYVHLTTPAIRRRVLFLLKRFDREGPKTLYDQFRRDPEIGAFVESYYADDFALRGAAQASLSQASANGQGTHAATAFA